MSVHKKGKAFVVRWREGSSNRSRTFRIKKDAEAFDRELQRIRQAGELHQELEKRRITIDQLTADWWQRNVATWAPGTIQAYAVALDLRIREHLGQRRVAQLTVSDVEHWAARLRADGHPEPSILRAWAALQSMLSMAVRDGIVPVNVAQQAKGKPRQRRTRQPYRLTPHQVEAIRREMLARGWHQDAVLLDLLAYAGLRPESEAVQLRWQHVRERSLLVVDTKRSRERTIRVTVTPLLQTLREHRLRSGMPDGDHLVVPHPNGDWTTERWRAWRRQRFRPACLAAGLPADVRPRDLRGSFVSLLVGEGRSIVEVARWCGHSAEVCLRDYADVFDEHDPDDRRPAAQVVAHARFGAVIHTLADDLRPVAQALTEAA